MLSKNKKGNMHDNFFRKMMEKSEVLKEFLEVHLPAKLMEKINLKTIERMPKSFVTDLSKDLIADLICKVKIDKSDGYLVFLIEHQSTPDQLMPFRIWQYTCEIISKHLDNNTGIKKIPLVLPLVVYNGKEPYRYSTDIKDLVDAPRILIEAYFLKPFQLIDLTQIDDEVLKEKLWAGAVSLAMKHIRTQDMAKITSVFEVIAEIYSHGERRFGRILLNYVALNDEFNNARDLLMAIRGRFSREFEEEMMTLAEQWKAEGEKRAQHKLMTLAEQLRAEGRTEIALNVLKETGDLNLAARVTGLTLEEIKNLQE